MASDNQPPVKNGPVRSITIQFEKDEDGWWTCYAKQLPSIQGFGSSLTKSVNKLKARLAEEMKTPFLAHPSTIFYEFKDWPPNKFTEEWVVTSSTFIKFTALCVAKNHDKTFGKLAE